MNIIVEKKKLSYKNDTSLEEKEIDNYVYELYNISEEERNIIELNKI